MNRKCALVLSGGGFKGAFQLGALEYLRENWSLLQPEADRMHFDIVAGISVGALNGLMIAMDEFDELVHLWEQVAENGVEEIYTSEFIDTRQQEKGIKLKLDMKMLSERFLPGYQPTPPSLIRLIRMLFSARVRDAYFQEILTEVGSSLEESLSRFRSIADNSPLKSKLERLARLDKISGTDYICGFVSLADGKYYGTRATDYTDDASLANGVLASTAMPVVWEPVEEVSFAKKQPRELVDGGIKNVSPLGDVIKRINADQEDSEWSVIIINCGSGELGEEDMENANIGKIALRALNDVAISEIFNNDLKEFIRVNDLVLQARQSAGIDLYDYDYEKRKRTARKLKAFHSIIVQPDLGVLGDTLVASRELIEKRIKQGYNKAQNAMEQLGGDQKFIIV